MAMGIESGFGRRENEEDVVPSIRKGDPIGETGEFQDVFNELIRESRQGTRDAALVAATETGRMGARMELQPNFTQDGAHEIHPDLQGITFQFWVTSPDSPKGMRTAVNFSGDAPKAPWASQLTGKAFRGGFSEAKSWLRDEAKRLAGKK